MNFIDILIVILLLFACWRGLKKGLIIELFTLLAVFAGLYAAIHFSDYLAVKLREDADWEWEYVSIVSFALCFLAVGAMVYFGGKMLEKVIQVVQLGIINRIAGAVFSIITMLFVMS